MSTNLNEKITVRYDEVEEDLYLRELPRANALGKLISAVKHDDGNFMSDDIHDLLSNFTSFTGKSNSSFPQVGINAKKLKGKLAKAQRDLQVEAQQFTTVAPTPSQQPQTGVWNKNSLAPALQPEKEKLIGSVVAEDGLYWPDRKVNDWDIVKTPPRPEPKNMGQYLKRKWFSGDLCAIWYKNDFYAGKVAFVEQKTRKADIHLPYFDFDKNKEMKEIYQVSIDEVYRLHLFDCSGKVDSIALNWKPGDLLWAYFSPEDAYYEAWFQGWKSKHEMRVVFEGFEDDGEYTLSAGQVFPPYVWDPNYLKHNAKNNSYLALDQQGTSLKKVHQLLRAARKARREVERKEALEDKSKKDESRPWNQPGGVVGMSSMKSKVSKQQHSRNESEKRQLSSAGSNYYSYYQTYDEDDEEVYSDNDEYEDPYHKHLTSQLPSDASGVGRAGLQHLTNRLRDVEVKRPAAAKLPSSFASAPPMMGINSKQPAAADKTKQHAPSQSFSAPPPMFAKPSRLSSSTAANADNVNKKMTKTPVFVGANEPPSSFAGPPPCMSGQAHRNRPVPTFVGAEAAVPSSFSGPPSTVAAGDRNNRATAASKNISTTTYEREMRLLKEQKKKSKEKALSGSKAPVFVHSEKSTNNDKDQRTSNQSLPVSDQHKTSQDRENRVGPTQEAPPLPPAQPIWTPFAGVAQPAANQSSISLSGQHNQIARDTQFVSPFASSLSALSNDPSAVAVSPFASPFANTDVDFKEDSGKSKNSSKDEAK